MPIISVIIPVYRVEPYLHRCVDSILAQTFTDFELILVDDGSPDNCGKICDEYAEKDSRVKVIHQENGGLSAARNAGLDWVFANSNSEWIAFVDSDDYVAENYLELLYNAAIENDADLSMCGFIIKNEEGIPLDDNARYDNDLLDNNEAFNLIFEKWTVAVAWNKLYNRKIFLNLRYPVGKLHEDEFVIHKIFGKCSSITTIESQLYFYIQRDGSITSKRNINNQIDTFEAFIDRCEYCNFIGIRIANEMYEGLLIDLYSKLCGEKLKGNNKKNFILLKNRYKKIFFAEKSNRKIKPFCWFYFNRQYIYLYKIRKKLKEAIGIGLEIL